MEVKTTWRRLGFVLFLLLVKVAVEVLIPEIFPFRRVETILLIGYAVSFLLYYRHKLDSQSRIGAMVTGISRMILFFLFLRGVKFTAFAEVEVLARHTWYFYYVPMLFSALFFFFTALLVGKEESEKQSGFRWGMIAVTACLSIFVLTNDLHCLVFRFEPGFALWDSDYRHGPVFFLVCVWQYGLVLAGILIMLRTCRVERSRLHFRVLIAPFLLGTVLLILVVDGKITDLVEFPEAVSFTILGILESCMGLGLIPTNSSYSGLMKISSIAAQITDPDGKPVFRSDAAFELTPEEIALKDGTKIRENTILRKMEIPGGFGFWQNDITILNRLNRELETTKERLSEEAQLLRLSNELKKKRKRIEQRTKVYDTIAEQTRRQSLAISKLACEAERVTDREEKERICMRITFLGAYIKRYANLMLLSEGNKIIHAGELGLALAESLRYLNLCGVPGEFFGTAKGELDPGVALSAYKVFELLLEDHLDCLQGVYATLSDGGDGIRLKITMEGAELTLTEEEEKTLHVSGLCCRKEYEDEVTYLCVEREEEGGDFA